MLHHLLPVELSLKYSANLEISSLYGKKILPQAFSIFFPYCKLIYEMYLNYYMQMSYYISIFLALTFGRQKKSN